MQLSLLNKQQLYGSHINKNRSCNITNLKYQAINHKNETRGSTCPYYANLRQSSDLAYNPACPILWKRLEIT